MATKEGNKMKNIEQLLAEVGIELGDKAETFNSQFKENYKTVAELDQKNQKLIDAQAVINDLKATVADASSQLGSIEEKDTQLQELKDKLDAAEEANRQAAEAQAAKEAEALVKQQFDAAVGDKKFSNAFVEEAVWGRVLKTANEAENARKPIADILAEITKDGDGVWASGVSTEDGPMPPVAGDKGISDATSQYLESHGLK